MELRHLRYFVAVAEELHFGRAAKRVHVSQPSLSAQIASLEDELGVRLLNRTKRRVWLTEAGAVFLEEARRLLLQSEYAVREARRAAEGYVGRLGVGFVPSAVHKVFERFLTPFGERFPDVEVTPHEMNTSVQVEALRSGWTQVGFLRLPSGHAREDLEVRDVLQEPVVVCLSSSHPLSALRRVPLESLAEEPFVMPSREREPGFNEQIVRICESAGFVPRVVKETTELHVGMGLTAAGAGLVLMPESVSRLKFPGITYRKLVTPAPVMKLSVAWHPKTISPVTSAFVEFTQDAGASLA